MAESSDDENVNEEWVFYKDRPEWADVTPVPQDDGPNPVVAIAYSDRFRDVFDHFRAILRSSEKSERSLSLTTDAIDLNPGNYTVWHYRRLILKALEKDLYDELTFNREIIEEHPKNYQVWNHRRILVEWLQDPQYELRLVEIVLARDSKNYHAWQHRQWVLKTFGLWEKELNFVDRLIKEDVRNNSAWNQRHFVIVNTTRYTPEVVASEINYAKEAILKAVHNESPWNYIRAILLQEVDDSMFRYPGIQEFVADLLDREKNLDGPLKSSYLHGFLVDLLENELANTDWSDSREEEKSALLDRASRECALLAESVDPVRANYWRYVERSLKNKHGVTSESA